MDSNTLHALYACSTAAGLSAGTGRGHQGRAPGPKLGGAAANEWFRSKGARGRGQGLGRGLREAAAATTPAPAGPRGGHRGGAPLGPPPRRPRKGLPRAPRLGKGHGRRSRRPGPRLPRQGLPAAGHRGAAPPPASPPPPTRGARPLVGRCAPGARGDTRRPRHSPSFEPLVPPDGRAPVPSLAVVLAPAVAVLNARVQGVDSLRGAGRKTKITPNHGCACQSQTKAEWGGGCGQPASNATTTS